MTELTLVRHGQAQPSARDEKSYDALSELGYAQARCLGRFINQSHRFDRIISGAMNRQIETAKSLELSDTPHFIDARLNEFDFFGIAKHLEDKHGLAKPDTDIAFQAYIPVLLTKWKNNHVSSNVESYAHFRNRTLEALREITEQGDRALIVTSTGVIATLTALALNLDIEAKSKIFLNVSHTSMHKFSFQNNELHLHQSGTTPHHDEHHTLYEKTYA
ncbi:histidine phosphatase family protein [Kiloniella majae]|uniref:histidine phosphatase family protein n=1 Tax=Kiloniella majae TaxID=1938558 RepID=UPI000A277511|nr:histidine phosphatase family protein [Kiloniella majae]